ncbi:hypothetical protein HA402_009857 [Bradysia odoriphaga]|nr:hypothetical protein HA402_009857 [Bradysia odoriphaga]
MDERNRKIYMTLYLQQFCKDSRYTFAYELTLGGKSLQKEDFKRIDSAETTVVLSNLTVGQIKSMYSKIDQREMDKIYLRLDLTIKCERVSPLQQLFLDLAAPELADFTFEIADEKIPAHKFILSARSPVLGRMLSNDCYKETQQSVMKVTETSPTIFKLFLTFLYRASLSTQSKSTIMELIKLADKYDVETLKRVCEVKLIDELNQTDCLAMYLFAHQYNCSRELIEKTFQFLQQKYFVGKILPPNLSENPVEVQRLVTKMEEFDNTLQEVSEELSNPSKKMKTN